MIWDSIWIMTLFDLAIISIIIYTTIIFYKRRQALRHFHAVGAVSIMLIGIGIIGLFYLADLFAMYALPRFMPMMRAMQIMKEMHLNYLWFVIVIGLSLLVLGISRLMQEVFPTHITVLQGLKDERQQLAQLATTDALTGLANRRMFYDEIDQVLAHARHINKAFAILFVDLDRFKPINDQAGHDVGDEVLRTIAGRIKENTRRSDIVARFGGDEFVVCLSGIDNQLDIRRIAESMVVSISQPIQLNGESHVIKASIGIAYFPDDGDSVAALIEKADSAMYDVKRHGGNGIRIFER